MEHTVTRQVLDRELDAVSDDPLIWCGFGNWADRWPDEVPDLPPATLWPRVEIKEGTGDVVFHGGSVYRVPTVEADRIVELVPKFLKGNRLPEHRFEAVDYEIEGTG